MESSRQRLRQLCRESEKTHKSGRPGMIKTRGKHGGIDPPKKRKKKIERKKKDRENQTKQGQFHDRWIGTQTTYAYVCISIACTEYHTKFGRTPAFLFYHTFGNAVTLTNMVFPPLHVVRSRPTLGYTGTAVETTRNMGHWIQDTGCRQPSSPSPLSKYVVGSTRNVRYSTHRNEPQRVVPPPAARCYTSSL